MINDKITTLSDLTYQLAENLTISGNKEYSGEKGLEFLVNEVYENTQGLLTWKVVNGITWEFVDDMHVTTNSSLIYIPCESEPWQAYSVDMILLRFVSQDSSLTIALDSAAPSTYDVSNNSMRVRFSVESYDTAVGISGIFVTSYDPNPPVVECANMIRMFDNPFGFEINI